jgi:hypothetical protein
MKDKKKMTFPWWLFALISVGTFIACGIYLGVISREGTSPLYVIQAAGFGIVGFLTGWGALASR